MKPAKLAMITLFVLMAIGGIGGVMLAGYSFIVRGGVG
ncbi:MAG TPA: protein YohO [Scandinavium sp.]